jgi:chromosome segregation ATPase
MPQLNVPEAIAQHRAIQPATDAYNALVTEQSQAQAEVGAAKRALPLAREADKRAYATALAADAKSKDPGEKETNTAQRAIDQAERRVAALNVAVADAEAVLHAAITAHHGDLMATLGERITNSQHALNDSLDALDTHLTAYTTAKATAGWLRNFPSGPGRGCAVPSLRMAFVANSVANADRQLHDKGPRTAKTARFAGG